MPLAKINNIKINYHTIGDGHPLILIAGLGIDNMSWVHQLPEFKKYFKVIVFDNRGIGKSTRSIGPYSIKMMSDDTIELLKYLNIKKSHVLSSSMGGAIAQEVAINYPDVVDKLVLCTTFAKLQNILEIFNKVINDVLEENVKDLFRVNPHKITFEKLFDNFLQEIFSKNFVKENRHLIELTLRKYLSKPTYGETFLKDVIAIHKHDTSNRLNLIKAETLIITGTGDRLVPPECSDILAEKIPNSKLKKIDNIGHGLHFEMPDVFNKIVMDFLHG